MSVYAQIGGRDAVAAAVEFFYRRVLRDPVLAPYFAGTEMAAQKAHMRAFLAVALGGPELYTGRDMGAAHRGLAVTDQAFDHVVEHLVATLTALGVEEALIEAIGAKLVPLRAVIVTRPSAAAA